MEVDGKGQVQIIDQVVEGKTKRSVKTQRIKREARRKGKQDERRLEVERCRLYEVNVIG